jgi:hypothetical protein
MVTYFLYPLLQQRQPFFEIVGHFISSFSESSLTRQERSNPIWVREKARFVLSCDQRRCESVIRPTPKNDNIELPSSGTAREQDRNSALFFANTAMLNRQRLLLPGNLRVPF